MQRDTGRKDDPFGFGGSFAGFGGFTRSGSLMSSFIGRRDPFDDPFFISPLESMFRSYTSNSRGNVFGETSNSEFLEQKPKQHNISLGRPIIQEISSDDEDDGLRENICKENQRNSEHNISLGRLIIQEISSDDEDDGLREYIYKENLRNSEHHSMANKGPYVHHPDDETEVNKRNQVQYRHDNRPSQQGAHTHSFRSSSVTYGGINGTYYTSSTTRRTGGDGVTVEESKQADTPTGKAIHRIRRNSR